jgi:hypothetical protein
LDGLLFLSLDALPRPERKSSLAAASMVESVDASTFPNLSLKSLNFKSLNFKSLNGQSPVARMENLQKGLDQIRCVSCQSPRVPRRIAMRRYTCGVYLLESAADVFPQDFHFAAAAEKLGSNNVSTFPNPMARA